MEPDTVEPIASDDDNLMRRAAEGDTAAFGQIVGRHQRQVVNFAARMLGGDVDAAADVAQETFLRLWRNRFVYRPQGALTPFLLRIARNLIRDSRHASDHWAALDDSVEFPSSGDTTEETVCASSLADAVRLSVSDLSDGQRAVFVLSHYDQLSYQEIADVLGCPIGTVASRKHLAVAALRQRLRSWIEEKE